MRKRSALQSIQVGAASTLIVLALTSAASAATPAPPFSECPALGADSSCKLLVDITPSGQFELLDNAAIGPYDGGDDTLFGVLNRSSSSVTSIPLHSPMLPIFGFDGDGLCTYTFTGSSGCPFLDATFGYGGPGVTYSQISADYLSGVVNFTPAVAPGGTTFFSLEQALDPTTVKVGPVFCGGTVTATDPAHTITGNVTQSLSLSGGMWTITNAHVQGSISLSQGASLMITNSTITGAISGTSGGALILSGSSVGGAVLQGSGEHVEICGTTVSGSLGGSAPPAGLQVCGSTIGGPVGATGSSGFVVIGDPVQKCATNLLTSRGSSVLSGDTAGVDMSANTISGSLHVTRSGGATGPLIAGNTIAGSLACDSNGPPPVDGGSSNKVAGAKLGQCAGAAF